MLLRMLSSHRARLPSRRDRLGIEASSRNSSDSRRLSIMKSPGPATMQALGPRWGRAHHLGRPHRDAEAFGRHAQTRSNSAQVLEESRYMTSSTGRCLILPTSSATRETSQGPDGILSNSPL
jgi:hypothetical protein